MDKLNTTFLREAQNLGILNVTSMMSDTTAREAMIPYPNEVGLMKRFTDLVSKSISKVVAKAHGKSKLAEGTGINRRTLYKVFDKDSNPSFELVTQIMTHLGLSFQVKAQPVKLKAKRKKSGSEF